EVLERGLAAATPVAQVMSVGDAVGAGRKGATAVARLQRPAQRGGDRAALAARVDDASVRVVQHGDDSGIAEKAPGRFRWNAVSLLGLTLEGGGVDVEDDLHRRGGFLRLGP